MKTQIQNHASRTEAIRGLEIGDSILLVPYADAEYPREQACLKSTATRLGYKIELKKALIVIEGEPPQLSMRVTRVL